MTTTSVIPHDRLHVIRDAEASIEQALAHAHRMPANKSNELDELGRMSAEAVLTQYEATAKEVEKMGDLVKDMVKRLGQSLIECDNDMRVVAETAAAIRDKGKHSEALIQQVSALSTGIRQACEDFKKKMEVR
jgi:hypothetical protein